MTRLRRIGVLVCIGATTALLSVPAALAEDGHRDGHDRGRNNDEHALTVQVAHDDLNDDRAVQVAPNQPVVDNDQEVEQELNDVNDD